VIAPKRERDKKGGRGGALHYNPNKEPHEPTEPYADLWGFAGWEHNFVQCKPPKLQKEPAQKRAFAELSALLTDIPSFVVTRTR